MPQTNHRWDARSVNLVAAREVSFGQFLDDDDESYVQLQALQNEYACQGKTETLEVNYLRTDFMPSSVLPGAQSVELSLQTALRSGGTELASGEQAALPADLDCLLDGVPVNKTQGRAGLVSAATTTTVTMNEVSSRLSPGMLIWLHDATGSSKPVWIHGLDGNVVSFAGEDTWIGDTAWNVSGLPAGSVLSPTVMVTPASGCSHSLCVEAVTALSHAEGKRISEQLTGLCGSFSLEETQAKELLRLRFDFNGHRMKTEERNEPSIGRSVVQPWSVKPTPLSMMAACLRINGEETAYGSFAFKPQPPLAERINAAAEEGRDGWVLADGSWKNEVEFLVFSEDSEPFSWTELARSKGCVDLSWTCGDEGNGVGLHCPCVQVREAEKKELGGLRAYQVKGVALKPAEDSHQAWSLCFSGKP